MNKKIRLMSALCALMLLMSGTALAKSTATPTPAPV